jgi:hypothetical protein
VLADTNTSQTSRQIGLVAALEDGAAIAAEAIISRVS